MSWCENWFLWIGLALIAWCAYELFTDCRGVRK